MIPKIPSSLIALSTALLCASAASAERPERADVLSAAEAICQREMHALSHGDYVRGDWAAVEQSAPPEGLRSHYTWGVTLSGLVQMAKATGESGYTDYVRRYSKIAARQFDYLQWQERTFGKHTNPAGLAKFMRPKALDDCGAITAAMIQGIRDRGDEPSLEAKRLIEHLALYVAAEQSRLEDGTLYRKRFWKPEFDETLWADDLYMGCPLLVRWAEYSNQPRFVTDAAKQIIGYSERLQDDDGLWFHGYFFNQDEHAPYKWGRANGWVMVATAEVLSAMPGDHPLREEVLRIFRHHVDGVRAHQKADGLWPQVLTEADMWGETSCTAMYSFAILRGIRMGWLDESLRPVADRGIDALLRHTTDEGVVRETTEGTGLSRELSYYAERERPSDDHHGQGPFLLAYTEWLLFDRDSAER